MRDWEKVIKKNLERAAIAENVGKSIKAAQIEEAILMLKKECISPRPEQVKASFKKSFCTSAVSTEYLRLVSSLLGKDERGKKSPPPCPKVIFMQNPLWNRAMEELTSHLKYPTLVMGSDLRSLCEAVSSSEADYCILPLCSSKDGYYPTFLKYVKSHELKICKTVQLTRQDSDEEISFALLSKHLETLGSPQRAAFTFRENDEVTLAPLLTALNGCNCRPLSILSAPLEYNIEIFEHRIEILLGDLSPTALLFFLDSAVPGHTINGIY